ncbi:GMC oxidoreductase, partial [Nonomuraea diastatica]
LQMFLTCPSHRTDSGTGIDLHVFPLGPETDDTGQATLTLFVGLLRPHSGGRLLLRSTDPKDSPHIDPGFLTDPRDAPRLINGMHLARRLAHTPTCRMGPPDDPDAVVSPTGAVHGIDHLHVIDASIMPTPPTANPNLTTMAIAEHRATTLP